MRARIHGDAAQVAAFLRANDYPHPWATHTLAAYSLMVRIEDDDGSVAGYVWATWEEEFVLQCHACIAEDYRARWLTPSVTSSLMALASLLGARRVQVAVARPDVYARFLRPLGFISRDHLLYKDIPENGLLQSSEASAPTGADASA